MIVEIGHFAVVAALVMALGLAVVGHVSAVNGTWRGLAATLASCQLVLLAFGFAVLVRAFLVSDFSVAYVAQNSNSLLPWYYRISATWGAHEGSFLLWTLIMGVWTWAVSVGCRRLPDEIFGRVLGTMGLLNFGFLLFLLSTSSPFERLLPVAPPEGADLNPLLQDFGLIVHPPLLYTGYVGFAVAFSFAIAALISGRLDAAWARWSRPWTNVAWAFLTVGIALGSWWAYYELGWGGWWFWDPVENASFMPWLAGTALLHSLAVTEKRGAFKSWTALLAIAAFSLALLGAFIVRSGVLTSVHAFAVDPERGLFVLALLALAAGGALTIYGIRAPTIMSRARYGGFSRELLLLVNNAILVVALAFVLHGTLYPLAHEAITGGEKTSVGAPYFNRGFVPLMCVLACFLALAPVARWKRTPLSLLKNSGLMCLAALCLGLALPLWLGGAFKVGAAAAVALGIWILLVHGADLWRRRRSTTRGYLGMVVAHIGFAVSLMGIGGDERVLPRSGRQDVGGRQRRPERRDLSLRRDEEGRGTELRRGAGRVRHGHRCAPVSRKASLSGPRAGDDRSRNCRRIFPGPLHRVGLGAARRFLGRSDPGQAAGSMGVAGRLADGVGRRTGRDRSALSSPGLPIGSQARLSRTGRGALASNVNRARLFIPIAVFAVLASFLYLGFTLRDPHELPSALIDRPFPDFDLPILGNPGARATRADLVVSGAWSTSGPPGARHAWPSTANSRA